MTVSKHAVFAAIIGLAAVAALPTSAFARTGWYLGGAAGDNFKDSETLTNGNNSIQADYSDNAAWQLDAGYALSGGWRPEFSFTSRSNDADSLSSQGYSTSNVTGHEDADTYMANLWYDIPMQAGPLHRLHPWLGGGIGMADVGVHGLSTSNLGPYISIDDSRSVFAYQFGAGIGYDLARNWMVTADFRYLATESTDFNYTTAVPQISGTVHGGYSAESLMFGLRYEFGNNL